MIKHTLLLFNLKVLAFLILFITGYCSYAHAQQKSSGTSITGVIMDATTHEPLIGVSVRIAGTNKATISDLDGRYTIGVDAKDKELTYSYVGYLTVTEKIYDRKTINVSLSEDSQMLDDVVVVGYGIQKKSHLTGSITKVELDGLGDIPSSNVGEALKGKIAGVQIQNLSGEVGVEPSIRVRGTASISASSSPLIIVDGFPSAEGLDALNMGDVESIEVLKDAASAAIYGSRAANGVIIITTKSGEMNKPKYSLKTSLAIKNPYKLHPIMSSKDYVDMIVEESLLKGTKLPDAEFAFHTMSNNTDWQKEGTRTANLYNTQLSISGGSKEVKYYISGGYVSDEGIMMNNDYERMNLRAKIDATLSKRIKIGVNLAPSYGKRERPTTNFIDFYRTPSWMPVRHTAETAAITGRQIGEFAHGAHFNGREYVGVHPITGELTKAKVSPYNTQNHNPVAILENDRQKQKDYRLQANTYIDVLIIDGLTFNSNNGISYGYRETNRYRNLNARKEGETNWGQYGNALTLDLLNENTLTYNKTWNVKHDFSALLGFSNELIKQSRTGIEAVGFPTDYVKTLNAAGEILHYDSSNNIATGTWKTDEMLVSAFSRLTYSYEQKYLLSASLRTDGSSKFGKNNKWAWFPSVSLGWRLTEEKFMKENVKWMNQAKLRLSYGITGNKEIGNYNNTNLLSSSPYPTGAGNGTIDTGIGNNSSILGNSRLKWEQTNEYNIGADFSFFRSRLGINIDYYYATTKSLLYQRNISSISGYQQKWTNQGKIRNKGLEIEVSTQNIRNKEFSWTTSVNFSLNRNKILDLGGEPFLINQGERNETYLSKVGGKSIQFYGFKTDGVWKNQEEIDSNPHSQEDAPGGMKPVDTNGDKVINDNDRVVIGDPLPDFTWGITNTIRYKGFDLSFLFQGVQGVDVINGDWFYNETKRWNKEYVSHRWISPEYIGDGNTPYYNNGRNIMLTDKAVEDASYIALRDITLGYQLPKKILKKTIFSKVRIYANAQNLGYWTTGNYRGINPEARHNSGVYNHPLIDGYQRGAFPIERVFSFGIDVNF